MRRAAGLAREAFDEPEEPKAFNIIALGFDSCSMDVLLVLAVLLLDADPEGRLLLPWLLLLGESFKDRRIDEGLVGSPPRYG